MSTERTYLPPASKQQTFFTEIAASESDHSYESENMETE
jgi:hypothetical protein